MTSTILVPLDGSERSRAVLPHVERLLHAEDARVELLFVLHPARPAEGEEDLGDRSLEARREAASRWLKALRADLSARGARAAAHVMVGEPTQAILAHAEGLGPSGLIAMASHGRSGVSRWVRGSVSEQVIRSSPLPVLVVNPRVPSPPSAARFARLLVPLDGSERSAQILPRVATLARRYDAEVLLVQVGVFLGLAAEIPGPVPVALPSAEALERALEPFARQLEAQGVRRVRTRGVMGASEGEAILDVAAEEGCDLIAMTTHGRSGVDRWLFGSVAESVLRGARTPVLLQRTLPLAQETPEAAGGALGIESAGR